MFSYHRLFYEKRKEGNVLFNDAFSSFYLQLYSVGHMIKVHSDREGETRCPHYISYYFQLATRVLYAPPHRQDNTYHSRGALAGARISSMGPHEGSIRRSLSERSTTELKLAPVILRITFASRLWLIIFLKCKLYLRSYLKYFVFI